MQREARQCARQGEREREAREVVLAVSRLSRPTRLRVYLPGHWSHGRVMRLGSSGPGPKTDAKRNSGAGGPACLWAGSRGPWRERKERGGGAARHQASRPRPGRRNGGSGIWTFRVTAGGLGFSLRRLSSLLSTSLSIIMSHNHHRLLYYDPFIIVLTIVFLLFLI